MRLSTIVKIALILALGALVWFLVISIQFPSEDGNVSAQAEAPQRLRKELTSLMQNVQLRIGNISINAAVQETYKSGEIHFRDFTMTQETDKRTVTISGKLAQTMITGAEVDFMEIEGKEGKKDLVRVVSSDGLDLRTSTLNYVNSKHTIFTQTPARFTLKNIRGRADGFSYDTEGEALELHGRVRVTYFPEEEPIGEADTSEATPDGETADGADLSYEGSATKIECNYLRFDQGRHTLDLQGQVQVSQPGSFLRAQRIEAALTEDNRQFVGMVAHGARAKARAESGEEPGEEAGEKASVEHGSSGIKKLKADRVSLFFATGDNNLLQRALAEGGAELELQKTEDEDGGKGSGTEKKNLAADRIEATIGPDGKGIQRLTAGSENGLALVEVIPAKVKRGSGNKEGNEDQPKTMRAPEITAEVDPETSEFTFVTMSGGLELKQGDTVVTASDGRLDSAKNELFVKGNPVLKDSGKRVEAKEMNVRLNIGSLVAENSVVSTFYPPEDSEEAQSSIFVIGEEAAETSISAGKLDMDYKNNVLRYSGGVRAIQGESNIDSRSLNIYQEEGRLLALEKVKATLILPKETTDNSGPEVTNASEDTAGDDQVQEREAPVEAGAGEAKGKKKETAEKRDAGKPGKSGEKEDKKQRSGEKERADTARLVITAERLDLDKKNNVLSLVKNINAKDGEMEITCQQLRYFFGESGGLKRAFAQEGVRIKIGPKIIAGDKAEYHIAERVLYVTGKNVSLEEQGQLQANHNKLTFDIANDTLRFDARADKLLKTRISTN
jgi:lipopolysaccharide export system protein LptA